MILDKNNFPKLFIIKVKNLTLAEFKFLLNFSDSYIKNRLNANMPEERKVIILVANIFRKYLIEKYFSIPFDKQEIKFNQYGKPYLSNKDVFFNVSYSGKYIVCGISNKNIGVDIQKIENYNQNIANYIFEDKIVDLIQNSDNINLEYIKQWAKLESFLKYKGTGFVNYKKGLDETIKHKFIYIGSYVISVHWD